MDRTLEELEADAESVRQALNLPGTARKTSMRRQRLREIEQEIAAARNVPRTCEPKREAQ